MPLSSCTTTMSRGGDALGRGAWWKGARPSDVESSEGVVVFVRIYGLKRKGVIFFKRGF